MRILTNDSVESTPHAYPFMVYFHSPQGPSQATCGGTILGTQVHIHIPKLCIWDIQGDYPEWKNLGFGTFCQPAWAVGNYSSSPVAARTIENKSTGGFSLTRWVTCILSDKTNCAVRFSKQFWESSPGLSWLQGRYTSGTLRKQFTKPTVQLILSPSTWYS